MIKLSPEQRRQRWLALGIVALAYVLSFFQRFAPAGIASDLAAAFQTSAASLGVLAATYFGVYTVMQVPTGVLVDTLGPRRILLLGGLTGGAGSLLFGLAPTLEWALVGRTLVGLGVSVTFIAMLKIIAVWFEEHRFATLTGLAMLIGNAGSVLAGLPLASLARAVGWRGVFVGLGLVSVLLGLSCWLLVRDRPPGGQAGRAVPAAPEVRVDRLQVWRDLRSVLKNRRAWPATLVNFGISGSFFAFGGLWAMPFLTQVQGMSRAAASSHLSVFFASFALGCVLVGSVSDRLRRRKAVVLVATHVYSLTWLAWLWGPTFAQPASYALIALMGLSVAGFVLTWACAKEVNPPRLSGMATSVTNMGGFLAGALLQPLVGLVIDLHWQGGMADGARAYAPDDIRLGLMLLAATAWLGTGGAWLLKETRCRNIWA
jgi:predicted MFS family arabinose efflux permease